MPSNAVPWLESVTRVRAPSNKPEPVIICIDDDDDEDNGAGHASSSSNIAVSARRAGPKIKTEPVDRNISWWSVDAVPLSPICISDDDDDDENSGKARPHYPTHPVVKQEDNGEVNLLGVEAAVSERLDAAVPEVAEPETAAPMTDAERIAAEVAAFEATADELAAEMATFDNEEGLFIEPYELSTDELLGVGDDFALDSLFSSPTPPAPIALPDPPSPPVLPEITVAPILPELPINHSRPASPFFMPFPLFSESPVLGDVNADMNAGMNADTGTDSGTLTGTDLGIDIGLDATAHAKETPSFSWPNLQAAIASSSPGILAESVRVARQMLHHLLRPLQDIEDLIEGPGWAQRIAHLQQHAHMTPVRIGIVGRTGAGKSSVINAVLDEDRVLPTNGLRACTAVVTEIAWNPSCDPAERYRAEIEFVQPDEWRRELTRLLGDLEDGRGNSSCGFEDDDDDDNGISAEARIALAKLRAVFPGRTASRASLDDAEVARLLGTVRTLKAAEPGDFYTQLQAYLDSGGNGSGHASPVAPERNGPPKMALWPLIKVVRLYLRSEALSTGVVLVDLPGFGDANAARDAVAERYISQCAALWMVSPITRAVDDREARELLGRSFRRQLVLDGAYNSMTFVCSKTDDLSVREVAESLDSAGEVRRLSSELAQLDQQLARSGQQLAAAQHHYDGRLAHLNSIVAKLDVLAAQVEPDGEAAESGPPGPLGPQGRKRTADGGGRGPAKRVRWTEDVQGGEEEVGPVDSPRSIADMKEEIEQHFQELACEREVATRELAVLDRLQDEYRRLEQLRGELASERVAMCLQLRSEYARTHIASDFARGRQESGGDSSSDKGPSSLPVFCVSSRAYQRFCGRSDEAGEYGRAPPGFRHMDETEIPQLQQHARRLGTECLARHDRKVLGDFAQLLTSLAVWVTSSAGGFGRQIHLDQERRGYEMRHLDQAYDELKHNLTHAAGQCIGNLRRILETEVLMKQSQLLSRCVDAAPKAVAAWAKGRRQGGLLFNTYRSICRNGGNPTTSRTRRNFNEDLLKPLLDAIPPIWEAAFATQIPAALAESQTIAEQLVEHFHRRMRDRPLLRLRTQNAGLGLLLDHEIRGVKRFVRDALELARHHADTFRRDANRLPLECVAVAMAPAYRACAQESGAGCLARMRTAMADYVEQGRRAMYASIDTAAHERLAAFGDGVLKEMLVGHHDSLVSLYHDCRSMIVGVEVPATTRSARDFVHQLLLQADAAFAPEALETGKE